MTAELPIPPEAQRDPRAVELIRVWVAENDQHVSVATGLWWDDPAAWGIALVDLARHIARAYELTEGKARDEVLTRIREGFDAEWDTGVDATSGGLAD